MTTNQPSKKSPPLTVEQALTEPPKCGIVMPISAINDCSESHWSEVFSILSDSLKSAGFKAEMVSASDEVTVIQKTIVHNLYVNPIVVCDVSEKNPNVMFELGMRLAFDKPTIIIKDDRTSFSFDTGVIEHIEYPRDLRFSKIVEFKIKLAEKIKATYAKQIADPNFSTFLRHFGEFKVSQIQEKEVSSDQFIIEELKDIKRTINRLSLDRPSRRVSSYEDPGEIDICVHRRRYGEITFEKLTDIALLDDDVSTVRLRNVRDHEHVVVKPSRALSDSERVLLRNQILDKLRSLNSADSDYDLDKLRNS